MTPIAVHGHAIVSDDDCIAGPDGLTPPSLRNEADWQLFQQALDDAALVVLGRLGHAANPNVKRRRRLVLSTSAQRLEPRDEAVWWNPDHVSWAEVASTLLPDGGIVAVPGGRRVFDLFLGLGFDAFFLARAHGVQVPGGVPIFSACTPRRSADDVLRQSGLTSTSRRMLDAVANVSLTTFERAAP